MIYQDRKTMLEHETAITEYLASFWNPEAVKKIQEMRSSSHKHKFKNDQEFEEHILSGEYKENNLLEAIKKIKELEQGNNKRLRNIVQKNSPKSKLPTDLSNIKSTLNKFRI